MTEGAAPDLSPVERRVLRNGIHQWLGPARCTDAVAVAIGFGSAAFVSDHVSRLLSLLDRNAPMPAADWRRLLISAEIMFRSGVLGCGLDWSIVTGLTDQETIVVLRGLERKLGSIVRSNDAFDL
jgi:hypothetical protein